MSVFVPPYASETLDIPPLDGQGRVKDFGPFLSRLQKSSLLAASKPMLGCGALSTAAFAQGAGGEFADYDYTQTESPTAGFDFNLSVEEANQDGFGAMMDMLGGALEGMAGFLGRPQAWHGDDPNGGFTNGMEQMCAAMRAMRRLVGPTTTPPRPGGGGGVPPGGVPPTFPTLVANAVLCTDAAGKLVCRTASNDYEVLQRKADNTLGMDYPRAH